MSRWHYWGAGVGIALLVVTSSLAVYYRNWGLGFEREWKAALAALEQQSSRSSPQPAVFPIIQAEAPARVPEPAVERRDDRRDRRREAPDPVLRIGEPDGTALPEAADTNRPRRRGMDWMESLRTNDPARYAEMQQSREEWRQRVDSAWAQKATHFQNRDTSAMAPAELEEYNLMVRLLDETRALSQAIQTGLEGDERRQAWGTVRSNMTVLTPLMEKERNRELYDLALGVGQDPSNATSFVVCVTQILENTSMRSLFPGGGIRGGGGRDRSGETRATPSPSATPPAN